MSTTNYPINPNFLSPVGFQFTVNRAKEMTFYCQSASLPGVSLIDTVGTETPFIRLNWPGTKLEYSPVTFTFKVDEDMLNYVEIYNWLLSMGSPVSFDQATAFEEENQQVGQGMFSDGKLLIETSLHNPNIEVSMRDMYPLSLTALEFDTTVSDIDHINATVSFSYRDFIITTL